MAFGSGQVASRSQPQCREHGVSIDCTTVVPVVKTKEVTHGRPMAASSGPPGQGPCHDCAGNIPHAWFCKHKHISSLVSDTSILVEWRQGDTSCKHPAVSVEKPEALEG